MNITQCLQVLREIKDVSIASIDKNGNPHIRIIDIMYADHQKIVICTARGKDFYHEVSMNPYVGIVALTKNYEMIRLHGPVEKMAHQKEWIDKIFEENPSMKKVYPDETRYILEAFCINKGELEYFDLSQQPIQRLYFSLGENKKMMKGFLIKKECIECGCCLKICPQQCIHAGTPYVIEQEHCLHCGLCVENCPVKAIHQLS